MAPAFLFDLLDRVSHFQHTCFNVLIGDDAYILDMTQGLQDSGEFNPGMGDYSVVCEDQLEVDKFILRLEPSEEGTESLGEDGVVMQI